jgi:hypothetical protein
LAEEAVENNDFIVPRVSIEEEEEEEGEDLSDAELEDEEFIENIASPEDEW